MANVSNLWGRALIVLACIAIGLIFPLAFAAAAFVAYTIYSDLQDARNGKTAEALPVIVPYYDQKSDYSWQERSEARTESVAEQAFLKTMIDAFQLKPDGDDLAGSSIRFAFQREILRYRVDFILNDWLIVEIDGAEWHSSPEAVERDGIRDAALRELDYSILRIPAKTVFKTPGVAVEQVNTALQKPTKPITVIERDRRKRAVKPQVAPAANVLKGLKAVGTSIDTLDTFVAEAQRRSTIASALTNATITFETERTLIENARSSAERHFELEKKFKAKPGLRQLYEENYRELNELIKGPPNAELEPVKIAYVTPEDTGDDEMDVVIRSRYADLLAERNHYLDTISSTLDNADLRHLVIMNISSLSLSTASELVQRHNKK